MTLEERQFPVGRWLAQEHFTREAIEKNITDISAYPLRYRQLTEHLSDEDLKKNYRENSWNIRQLIHHVADTHLWHFIRLKQILTEENPVGFVGNVNAYAALPDSQNAPVEDSLTMLDITHKRYVYLFSKLNEKEYEKTYYHPTRQLDVNLLQAVDMVAWHCRHHYAHIQMALQ
jgi:hypothetical protein